MCVYHFTMHGRATGLLEVGRLPLRLTSRPSCHVGGTWLLYFCTFICSRSSVRGLPARRWCLSLRRGPACRPATARTRHPRNVYGEETCYHALGGCKRAKLPAGVGVAFDSTSPHRAPGVGRGEGFRLTGYIGFQAAKTYLDGLPPVLAHHPGSGIAFAPAFKGSELALGTTTGGKRLRE
jgi:hypothetical protein